MFVQLSKTEIKNLETQRLAQQISRWESFEKARAYYSNDEGIFTAYKMNLYDMKTAYSTPIVVFKLKKLPTQ
ncbi:hypothetical protein BK141_02680 [Paenibacillus sp. FSL R5-0765]|nr:hypothetical protein BK141_02680 [Paenibacillus sp. FSL R5-0765]